jgi:hypothetical protein
MMRIEWCSVVALARLAPAKSADVPTKLAPAMQLDENGLPITRLGESP